MIVLTGLAVFVGGIVGGILRYVSTARCGSRSGLVIANTAATALLALTFALTADPSTAATLSAGTAASMSVGTAASMSTGMTLSPMLTALLGTGLAGTLSTWSSLAKEIGLMLVNRQWWLAVAYIIATLVLGLAAAAAIVYFV